MAKQSGIGSSLIVGAFDISGQIGALTSVEATRATADVTSIQSTGPELIPTIKDGSLAFTSYWTGATAGEAHLVLSVLPRTDVQVSALIGATVGSAAACMVAKEVGYAPTRGADGSLVATTTAKGSGYGLEWGEMLTTGKQTFASGSTNSAELPDYGATSSLFGSAAYLHVISLGSGTPTLTIADATTSGGSFTGITGMVFTPTVAGVTRVQGAVNATVRRWVRMQVTGTYTNLVCVVVFVRYLETP